MENKIFINKKANFRFRSHLDSVIRCEMVLGEYLKHMKSISNNLKGDYNYKT